MSMDPRVSPTAADRLDDLLPDPHFVERHQRTVAAPADAVWAAALAVSPREVRLLSPLMALRGVPALFTRGRRETLPADDTSLLAAFEAEGFVRLHVDEQVRAGRAAVVYGAAGRFWSLTDSTAVVLPDAGAFVRHRGPGTAKVAFSLEVVDRGGSTTVTTETRVAGTDAASRRTFGRYWMLIRGPSGLIRRSWLAAIDRRARA